MQYNESLFLLLLFSLPLITLKAVMQLANMIEPEVLMRYIRVFSELSSQIKYASQKRVLIEIALIKLTKPAMESNYDSILNRLSLIEKQLEQGIIVSKPSSDNFTFTISFLPEIVTSTAPPPAFAVNSFSSAFGISYHQYATGKSG